MTLVRITFLLGNQMETETHIVFGNQNPSLVYTISIIIISSVIAAVSNYFVPKLMEMMKSVVIPTLLEHTCWKGLRWLKGERSIRKKWQSWEWNSPVTRNCSWKWTVKDSKRNKEQHGISFSELRRFNQMRPAISVNNSKKRGNRIVMDLSYVIFGGIGECIFAVKGRYTPDLPKMESREIFKIEELKKTTLMQMNESVEGFKKKREQESEFPHLSIASFK